MDNYKRTVFRLISELPSVPEDADKLKQAYVKTFLEDQYGNLVLSHLIDQVPMFEGPNPDNTPEKNAYISGRLSIVSEVLAVLLISDEDTGEEIDEDE